MATDDTETAERRCPYCGSGAVLVWRLLHGEGGETISRKLVEVRCSNPQCRGEGANQGPARVVREAAEGK